MRNFHNLSHEHKTSLDMGQLVPVCTEEVLPGDTFIHDTSALVRVAPLAYPVMHRVELRLHHFYVPNRLLVPEWEDIITGESDSEVPALAVDTAATPLVDYMGMPPVSGLSISCLPVRAYNLIWNEMYRDQNLQSERNEDDMSIARCAWQRDYFTIARPQPQQGDPVEIPVGLGSTQVMTNSFVPDGAQPLSINNRFAYAGSISPDAALIADMSTGSAAISIDDLRRSIAMQRFAEARMRFGSRYVDYLRFLGVNPSDGRLDRPEYLGGGKETLSFSEVVTSAEGANSSPGELYGHGIGLGRTRRYRKMFEEHGWVLTLMSARPKTVYQEAVPRKFGRRTTMDFWQKELEVLPWQEVNKQEVHHSGDPSVVFGYVPRYEEYRHAMSFVSSTLRGGIENDWHMARSFQTAPDLNGSFIECTPTDRIYQDTNQPEMIVNIKNSIISKRLVRATASQGGLQ